MRYITEKGAEIYLTASGTVPKFMMAQDVETLINYHAFCDMMVCYLKWIILREKLI